MHKLIDIGLTPFQINCNGIFIYIRIEQSYVNLKNLNHRIIIIKNIKMK
jgi:hypothetical protein